MTKGQTSQEKNPITKTKMESSIHTQTKSNSSGPMGSTFEIFPFIQLICSPNC